MTRRSRLLARAPMVGWLVIVWVLLWGPPSLANLLSGLLVAVVVLSLFPYAGQPVASRLSLPGIMGFLAYNAVDLFRSSLQVAWLAVRPGRPPSGAVIAVPVLSHSDALLSVVANTISLTPGTMVVETDRVQGRLFVHVLLAPGSTDLGPARRASRRTEDWVVRALGSAESRRHSVERREGSP